MINQKVKFQLGRISVNSFLPFELFHFRAKQSGKYENLTDKRYALQGKRQRNRDIDYTKQFQCKRFKRGECEKGASCKFSHDELTSNDKQTVMSVDVNIGETIKSVDVNNKDTTMSVDAKT